MFKFWTPLQASQSNKMPTILAYLLLLCYLVLPISSAPKIFCSIYCQKTQCNSATSNDCKACRAPFTDDGTGTCAIDPITTGYDLVDTSSDIGGGITVNSPISNTGVCGFNTYFGNLSDTSTFTFTDSLGPQVGHYELRVMMWVIVIENWAGSQKIRTSLNGGTAKSNSVSSSMDNNNNCGGGGKEYYLITDNNFFHNESTPYTITVSTDGNKGLKWGIQEVIVMARLCNSACTACFGATVDNCTMCEEDTPMYLSATTCAVDCKSGYGKTSYNNICVLCDAVCIQCFQTSANCSSCKTSGTNEAFLVVDNFTCMNPCPEGYFSNKTLHTCDLCEPECISCKFNSSYCYECNTALGYAWMNYVCYNPCPVSTFLDNADTNCTACSVLCYQCQVNSTYCSVCTLTGTNMAYLLDNQCYKSCPANNYGTTNNGTFNQCIPCDASCQQCTGTPTPCQYCALGFFLFNETCSGTCPGGSDYFPDDTTRQCLSCADYCVKLKISMYFSNSLNHEIYVDMIFTDPVDFTTFPYKTFQTFTIDNQLYTIEMFDFSYSILSSKSYRITIAPKGYIFLYNATITVTTEPMPGYYHYSTNNRPFHDSCYQKSANIVWFVIKAPEMSETENSIIDGVATMSDTASTYLTMPYVQELKKMGLFMFLFGGAQITSCSVLVNNIPSQNMYEGVRFWAIFVFFDVPKWERNSDKTKNVIVPPVTEVIKNARMLESGETRMLESRQLFDSSTIQWRFSRTGHTSFFIYDMYPLIFLVGLSWLLMLVAFCLNKKKPKILRKRMGAFYTLLHKVHEITIMYLMLSTILEWMYFDSKSVQRWISLGVCLLFNAYFLTYELYIYYDMIKYPVATLGNEKYEYYAIRYSHFLKNIRYVQYDLKAPWSPKHWLRPYNYHILSYYKKLMMIVSLPIFYHTVHAQPAVLMALQVMEIVRLCLTWPYFRRWRNIYRLFLEVILLIFFICVLASGVLVQEIMLNNDATIERSINQFYVFGWIGFVCVFVFNLSFLGLNIFDMVNSCRKTNLQMLDEPRRGYYYQKVKQYETQNENVPLGLLNKWVRLGNLNERSYDTLPAINIRIESYKFSQNADSSFNIQARNLMELFMNAEFNYSKENNIDASKKINKNFRISRRQLMEFNGSIEELYKKYDGEDPIDSLILKTFLKVEQDDYKPGERIDMKKGDMTQFIEIQSKAGKHRKEKLPKLLDGFPLSEAQFQLLN